MAREIGIDHGDAFRAVLVCKDGHTWYEGIYNKKGTARQRVSFWRSYKEETDNPLDMERSGVEKAVITWAPLVD